MISSKEKLTLKYTHLQSTQPAHEPKLAKEHAYPTAQTQQRNGGTPVKHSYLYSDASGQSSNWFIEDLNVIASFDK